MVDWEDGHENSPIANAFSTTRQSPSYGQAHAQVNVEHITQTNSPTLVRIASLVSFSFLVGNTYTNRWKHPTSVVKRKCNIWALVQYACCPKSNVVGKIPQGVCLDIFDAPLCGLFLYWRPVFHLVLLNKCLSLSMIEDFLDQHAYKCDNDNVAKQYIANWNHHLSPCTVTPFAIKFIVLMTTIWGFIYSTGETSRKDVHCHT